MTFSGEVPSGIDSEALTPDGAVGLYYKTNAVKYRRLPVSSNLSLRKLYVGTKMSS